MVTGTGSSLEWAGAEAQRAIPKFLSALGDLDAVRASLDEHGNDLAAVNEAFLCACGFAAAERDQRRK